MDCRRVTLIRPDLSLNITAGFSRQRLQRPSSWKIFQEKGIADTADPRSSPNASRVPKKRSVATRDEFPEIVVSLK